MKRFTLCFTSRCVAALRVSWQDVTNGSLHDFNGSHARSSRGDGPRLRSGKRFIRECVADVRD
jgi:hypothetical protein